jgi:hypothetical protein
MYGYGRACDSFFFIFMGLLQLCRALVFIEEIAFGSDICREDGTLRW